MSQESKTFEKVILVVGLLTAVVFLVGVVLDNYPMRMAIKGIPIICLMAWLWKRARGKYVALIQMGLLFSLAGDLLLEASPKFFLYGLVAFLIAHLFYISAFLSENRKGRWLVAIPFVLWGAGAFLFLHSGLGKMALPVGIYITVVCSMMWRACACIEKDSELSKYQWAAAIGAITFAFSDTCIAFNKFYKPFDAAKYIIMITYWGGQLGLTYSALRFSKKTTDS